MSGAAAMERAGISPGDILELNGLRELKPLEDAIARAVMGGGLNEQDWDCRLPIDAHLHPPGVQGRFEDITLTVLDDPYTMLITAIDREWKFTKDYGRGGQVSERKDDATSGFDSYLGFAFHAVARSSGRGIVTPVDAELYYYPPVAVTVPAGHLVRGSGGRYFHSDRPWVRYKNSSAVGGTPHRVATVPHVNRAQVETVTSTARRIGLVMLEANVSSPYITPMGKQPKKY